MINCWVKAFVNFAFGFAAASVLFLLVPSRDKSEEDVETLEEERNALEKELEKELKAIDRIEKLEKELENELKSLEKELDNMGRLAEKEENK